MTSVTLTGKAGTVAFEPRARLMKLIGGELVSDEVVAVTELVKNAYDADARTVRLDFIDVASGGGQIVISDDGYGMTLQDVADYWMQPGGTSKGGARQHKSASGRRVLGAKGIGRFAVDKLGSQLTLSTCKKGQRQEVVCNFDWSEFEHDTRMLSDIRCAWEVQTSRMEQRHGTVLRISDLRTPWDERLFRKLCLRLGRLKAPFLTGDKFKIVIESNDFADYAGEISVDYLERAPHRVSARFDGEQTVVLDGVRGQERLTWNGDGELECGPVQVRLYGFDLETPAIAKVGPIRDVRGWLREWTGVSVYRDGFRLSPYGEPNDDWLRLDQRRVNNPVVCLSNNQVIGFVEIGSDANPTLIDQTNREGLISNKPFADLRRLVLFVMQQLERSRQLVRHPVERGALRNHDSVAVHRSVADELEELAAGDRPATAARLKAIARKVRDSAEHDLRRVRALADGYAELAAVGQVAEEASRRAKTTITVIERDVGTLSNGASTVARKLLRHIETLRAAMALLEPVQSTHGTRRRTTDLQPELQRAVDQFAGRLAERGIKVDLVPVDELVRVEMRPENLQRVLTVLFNNSMDWLHRTENPRIRITVEPDATERHCAILFADNGPGIPESMAARVFEPMESGREGARGMGLTIARNIVESGAGGMEIVQDGRRKGATIRILLPRKRTRAVRGR